MPNSLLATTVLPFAFACLAPPLLAQDSSPAVLPAPNRSLELAEAAAAWLAETAVPFGEIGACGWRAVPAATAATRVATLYSGAAGPVLFLLELAQRSKDPSRWRDLGLAGARGLATDLPRVEAAGQAGLFTGVGGVLVALQVAAENCGDREGSEHLGEQVTRGLAWLEATARPSTQADDGITFGPVTDVISGDAGIGEFALWLADRHEDHAVRARAEALASGLATHLAAVARDATPGCRWPMSPTYPRFMPNYSHGTAGVAAFLASAAERGLAGRERALGGGRWLLQLADDRGMVFHHQPGGEALFYWGWCHGPAGTSILFERLHELTGDAAWREAARKPIAAVLESGLPGERRPGLWQTVGACCGTAGLGHYLLRADSERDDVRVAIGAIVEDLSARAAREDSGSIHWPQAEHRVRPDLIQSQVGWAQGAAGIGMFLLRVHAWQEGLPATERFPWEP